MRYLALGDSFTIGTGVGADAAFPARLAARLRARGLRVVLEDPAVNGYTTDDLIAYELPLVAAFAPTLVTVLIGANDIVRGSTLERYRQRVRAILARVRADAPGADVIGLPQPEWSRAPAAAAFGSPEGLGATIRAFNVALRDEVAAVGRYVDLFPLMERQATGGLLASDGLHPSAEAHEEWAAALDAALG